jgi:hypothetical protein
MVYDKTDTLIATQFFKLADLEQEINDLGKKVSVQPSSGNVSIPDMTKQIIVEEETEEGVENVWDLEPSGRIHMKFKFKEEHLQGNQIKRGNLERARLASPIFNIQSCKKEKTAFG